MKFTFVLIISPLLTGCFNPNPAESSDSFQVHQLSELTRIIDLENKSVCYKTPGGQFSCLNISSDINLSSVHNFAHSLKFTESSILTVIKDSDFNNICYKTSGGKLSCLHK